MSPRILNCQISTFHMKRLQKRLLRIYFADTDEEDDSNDEDDEEDEEEDEDDE